MGLFNFFKNNQSQAALLDKSKESMDIPKDGFAENSDLRETSKIIQSNPEAKGIEAIYTFLQADYETKGYSDALTSPDDSYKLDNIKLIKLDLQILIQQVNTYYGDLIRELEFHIGSRSRAGLIDLVDELKTRKEMVLEHMGKVKEVNQEMEAEAGMPQRIILSYQRGFMRGLSAITQSNVLNKKL